MGKTGLASHTDAFVFRGIALAVEELNGSGGLLDHPVQVIEIDNQSTPLGSKQAAKTALDLGVTAVIGCSWSSHSLAMAPLFQEASVPMISPLSTNPEVTRIGDYIFRVCFVDSFQGQVMAQFATEDLHAGSAVVLINVSSPYSMDLADFFIKSFTTRGGQVLWKGKYREKAVDFSVILDEVRRHAPDAVFLPGYAPDSALVIRQATAMGIEVLFLGGDGWGSSAVLDRGRIRDALSETRDFHGATGTITFDKNGDPVNKSAVILQFQNRSSAFVKVISPVVIAKEDPVSTSVRGETVATTEQRQIEEKQ